jgi:hypothetical protein
LRRNISIRPTGYTRAQRGVSPPIQTSRAEEKKLLEGEEPSIGYPFGISTRNTSSINNQATSPLTTRTRSISKYTADTKTNYL